MLAASAPLALAQGSRTCSTWRGCCSAAGPVGSDPSLHRVPRSREPCAVAPSPRPRLATPFRHDGSGLGDRPKTRPTSRCVTRKQSVRLRIAGSLDRFARPEGRAWPGPRRASPIRRARPGTDDACAVAIRLEVHLGQVVADGEPALPDGVGHALGALEGEDLFVGRKRTRAGTRMQPTPLGAGSPSRSRCAFPTPPQSAHPR